MLVVRPIHHLVLEIFFPLSDENISGSWFESSFQPSQDGFIAAFCLVGSVVGSDDQHSGDDSALLVRADGSSSWLVTGASSGTQTLIICDAAGRSLMRSNVVILAETPYRVDIGKLAKGVYVLRIGDRSTKILVP